MERMFIHSAWLKETSAKNVFVTEFWILCELQFKVLECWTLNVLAIRINIWLPWLFDLLDMETKQQKVKSNLPFCHSVGYVEIQLTTTPCYVTFKHLCYNIVLEILMKSLRVIFSCVILKCVKKNGSYYFLWILQLLTRDDNGVHGILEKYTRGMKLVKWHIYLCEKGVHLLVAIPCERENKNIAWN